MTEAKARYVKMQEEIARLPRGSVDYVSLLDRMGQVWHGELTPRDRAETDSGPHHPPEPPTWVH